MKKKMKRKTISELFKYKYTKTKKVVPLEEEEYSQQLIQTDLYKKYKSTDMEVIISLERKWFNGRDAPMGTRNDYHMILKEYFIGGINALKQMIKNTSIYDLEDIVLVSFHKFDRFMIEKTFDEAILGRKMIYN
jgi:hypothetical protein